ncbi:MAG: endonuclease [Kiritimatiellia bacterium]|jgi:hypothetical protein
MTKTNGKNRYVALIEEIFTARYRPGDLEVAFDRKDLVSTAKSLGIELPKNLGDVLYSFRYRVPLPTKISKTAGRGRTWVIKGAGRSRYRFVQVNPCRIEPDTSMMPIKVPNATPEILLANAFDDEQALLAKIRYNRLIDLFLEMTAHSLQNHLRSTVKDIGQIEIDELYVGVNKRGKQFIVPVQAKTRKDRHGSVQTEQDIAFCRERFPKMICRPVSVHALDDNRIAFFELTMDGDEIRIVDQKHYTLVPSSEITDDDLKRYANG